MVGVPYKSLPEKDKMFTNKTKSRPETAPWERFCKDEARRAAHDFLEKVRRLQTIDQSSMEIPENVFATKFSAHFMDEVMDLTGAPNDMNVPGDFSRNKKSGTGKSWWNIFKRKQNSREDRGALTGSAANKNASNHSVAHGAATTTTTILEAQVKMLDMNKSSHELSWKACRLVLTSEQGNHQLEIYCPPKVRERERVCVCVCVCLYCKCVCIGTATSRSLLVPHTHPSILASLYHMKLFTPALCCQPTAQNVT